MANGSYVMHENSHKEEEEREKFLLLQNKGSYENSNSNSVKNFKERRQMPDDDQTRRNVRNEALHNQIVTKQLIAIGT
jgi:hypothetical protein